MAAAAVIGSYFAPLQSCTGGGGGSGGGDGGQLVTLAGGLARRYPPFVRYGWDDIAV